MKLEEIDAAAGKNSSLRRVLSKIQSWATGLENTIGVDPNSLAGGDTRLQAPPQVTPTITGAHGRFLIALELPATAIGPMLHEISISTTIPFLNSETVVKLPSNPATYVEVTSPNSTKYFQIRSRYYASDFNQPRVIGPISSGV